MPESTPARCAAPRLSVCRAPAERLWRGQIDEALVKKLARTARSVLAPMASIFGGIVGQEVAKAVSGKHHPVFQFVYLDAAELLPDYDAQLAEEYQVCLSSHHGGARAQCRNIESVGVAGGALTTIVLPIFVGPGLVRNPQCGLCDCGAGDRLALRCSDRCGGALSARTARGDQVLHGRMRRSRLRALQELCDDGRRLHHRQNHCYRR